MNVPMTFAIPGDICLPAGMAPNGPSFSFPLGLSLLSSSPSPQTWEGLWKAPDGFSLGPPSPERLSDVSGTEAG